MKTSKKGLELIMKHEGFRAEAYRCPGGVWTIGYGHTGAEVKSGMKTTEEEAKEWLRSDVQVAEAVIGAERLSLTQQQFDALVSFVYNVGTGNFRNSTLLKKIREDPQAPGIREAFLQWKKAKGVVLPGLVRRRQEEADLYFGDL